MKRVLSFLVGQLRIGEGVSCDIGRQKNIPTCLRVFPSLAFQMTGKKRIKEEWPWTGKTRVPFESEDRFLSLWDVSPLTS